jgi:hypothetical protein
MRVLEWAEDLRTNARASVLSVPLWFHLRFAAQGWVVAGSVAAGAVAGSVVAP